MSTLVASPISRQPPATAARGASLSPAAVWGTCLIAVIVAAWAGSLIVGFRAALSVLTVVGFAAAVVGLRWPVLGLLGISMLCTLDPITRGLIMEGGILRFNTLNYWLVIVMLLGLPLILRLADPQTRLFQAFLVVLSVGLLFTPDLYRGVLHLLSAVTVFGLFVYFIRSIDNAETWFWLGLVNGVLASMGGLMLQLHHNSLSGLNPNAVNKFPLTALICICLAAHFVAGRSRPLLILGALAAVNFVWVFLTGSRGGLLISLFCALFLLMEVHGFFRRFMVASLAGVLAIIAIAPFTELQDRTIARIEKLFDPHYSLVGRTSGRSDLAIAGALIFLDHPFGVGTGGFAETWENFGRREQLTGSFYHAQRQAHSAWIKTLAEAGLPGILFFMAYVLSFAVSGWRQRREGMFSLGMLVTGVLGVAFISTEFQGKGFWLLAAAVTALLHYRHRRKATGT